MLCVLHSPLLLLTSLMTALNLNLNPVPGLTLIGGIEKSSMQDKGAPEVLEYAVIKYNENHRDLHLNWFVEVTMSKRRCVTLEVREPVCVLDPSSIQWNPGGKLPAGS